MGYKSEGMGIVVHTINGGRTEVLGGVINVGRTGDNAFVAEDSQLRISTASHGWRSVAYFRNAIHHTQNGKTTIVNLLCRFFEPKAGTICIGGRDYEDIELHAIQSRIGMVLQTPHLFSGSIRDNIRYGKLDATDGGDRKIGKVRTRV